MPNLLPRSQCTMGCNCLWSPSKTIWLGLWLTSGMKASGSVAMAHSSMIICCKFSILVIFGFEAAVQVHRMTSCFTSSSCRARFRSFL
uniref:Uncharacterized protein n=1 Tax=Anguilla anguilla TaxID=7936 RepID=A0A0E9XUI9_ANGAN